jgi:hypothetical protein
MRCQPVFFSPSFRKAKKTFELEGYRVPKGWGESLISSLLVAGPEFVRVRCCGRVCVGDGRWILS